MNQKKELLKIIEDSHVPDTIRSLCKTLLERAYSAGFEDGFSRGTQTATQIFQTIPILMARKE